MNDLQTRLAHTIKTYVAESPLARLRDIDGAAMWDEPLVGFADGDDPLFTLFKTVVGEFHLTPRSALRVADMQIPVSVVSWVLPIAAQTRSSNAQMVEGPSLRWNHSRFQGEDCNDSLRRHVVAALQAEGYMAVAPVISPAFVTNTERGGGALTWSERHIAYAAGLGTFSLSDGLITAKGIAHRCGSVVFNAACIPSPRPYSTYQEYCSYAVDGSCGTCIERCPAGAISSSGHDKVKCRAYMNETLAAWTSKPGYIGSYVACGLCQTKVPCEHRIPARKAARM